MRARLPLLLALALALGLAARRAPGEEPAEAALRVEAALEAGRLDEVAALARRDDPDPWLVAERLLLRGRREAALAFATAARRPDLDALPAYVAAWSERTSHARHATLSAARRALAGGRGAAALAALWPMDEPSESVLPVLEQAALAEACTQLEMADPARRAHEAAARAAERLGWLSRAASHHAAAGQLALAAMRLDAAERSLASARELSLRRGRPRDVATAASWLANVAFQRGDLHRARDLQLEVVALMEPLGDDAATARGRTNLAVIQSSLGRKSEARGELEAALATFERVGDVLWATDTRASLGAVLADLGDFDRADAQLQRAHDEQRAQGRSAAATLTLGNLGTVRQSRGDLAGALTTYERASDGFQALGDQAGLAWMISQRAVVYNDLRDHARALELLEQARALHVGLGERGMAASALAELGTTLAHMGEHARGHEVLEAAARELDALGSDREAALARTSQGQVLAAMGDHAGAAAAQRAAAERFRGIGDRAQAAVARSRLGEALHMSGDLVGAAAELEQAHAELDLLGDAPAAALTDGRLARLALARGDPSAALAHARRALGGTPRFGGGHSTLEAGRSREPLAFIPEVGAEAAAAAGDLESLALMLEVGRAGALVDGLASRAQLWSALVPAELRAVESEARLQETAAQARLQLALGTGRGDQRRAALAELEAARRRTSAAVARIQREAHAASAVVYVEPIGLREMRALLGPDQALVLYALGESRARALVVVRDGARHVDLGPASALQEAAEVLDLRHSGSDPAQALQRLQERLVAPLALDAGCTRVLISPEGVLALVPFALLLPESTVTCVPSATTYGLLRASAAARGDGVLALGDPEYLPVRERGSAGAQDRRRLGALPALPGSGAEARAVGTHVLLGEQATRDGLLNALAQRHRWACVHLACHGLVDAEQPLRSALALAPAEQHDGRVHACDVLSWQVPADLVVLSACSSGAGRLVRGEGLVGLARAFMLAGAPRVLCSLWKVDDRATLALMTRFHELWRPRVAGAGLAASEALRRAQEHVRQQPGWEHPFYWGAWVLWGLDD